MNTNIRTSGWFKGALLGVCLALWVSGCAVGQDDAQAPSDETAIPVPTSVEDLGDGNLVLEYDAEEEAIASDGKPEEAEAYEAASRNCVYIDYCRAPGTGRIVCRSRHCNCTHQEASDECFRDAQAVCGNSLYMTAYICGSD